VNGSMPIVAAIASWRGTRRSSSETSKRFQVPSQGMRWLTSCSSAGHLTWWAAWVRGDPDAMVSHRRQARQAAGGLTLRHPFGATYSRVCPWQPQVPWGNAIRCMGHTPGSASGGRRLIAVTLAQRAATGAMDCNHYAATLAMGQGATMQLARRTCGTCARLGKWCAAFNCGHLGAACIHRRV